jgi:hypothetical protein
VAQSSRPVVCQIIWLVPRGCMSDEPQQPHPNPLIPRGYESRTS